MDNFTFTFINYFMFVGACKKQDGRGGGNVDCVALGESDVSYSCWGSHKPYTILAAYTAWQEVYTCGIWCRAIFQVRTQPILIVTLACIQLNNFHYVSSFLLSGVYGKWDLLVA